ncbi:MAG: hypothetical protein JSR98_00460 [Proteobacteria bacterium]|nr:hypothetical protein [Pseudomonadota bacterium]
MAVLGACLEQRLLRAITVALVVLSAPPVISTVVEVVALVSQMSLATRSKAAMVHLV